jgi:hypothetical protein
MICGHGPNAIPFDDPKRTCILGETPPLTNKVQSLTGAVNALTNQVSALADEARALRRELQAMRQSKSWQLTRPLRFLRWKFFDL